MAHVLPDVVGCHGDDLGVVRHLQQPGEDPDGEVFISRAMLNTILSSNSGHIQDKSDGSIGARRHRETAIYKSQTETERQRQRDRETETETETHTDTKDKRERERRSVLPSPRGRCHSPPPP